MEVAMVDISIGQNEVTVTPRGLSKLWTLRRRVRLPLSAIRAVRLAPPGIGHGWYKGIRVPGTHIPGMIVAGRFYHDGGWEFWDVRGSGSSAMEIELEGASFQRVIVDVADRDAEVSRLQAALASRP
jgi:hypothetical protein